MKRALFFFLFTSFFLSLPVFFKRLTCGFKWAKLDLHLAERPQWEVSPLDESVRQILAQKYRYLSKGAQCYVFESQDHQYVVKFFRYDQVRKFSGKRFPISQEKVERLFAASCLAYQRASEETGLLYLHLNATPLHLPPLVAKGPIGQSLRFSLDQYRFAVQKKAEPFRTTLRKALQAGDGEKMARLIDSFVSLLFSRNQKGILNGDPTLSRNFGFVGDQAVEIDFGSYYLNPHSHRSDFDRYAKKLRHWLKKHGPEWVEYLDERIQVCQSASPSLP